MATEKNPSVGDADGPKVKKVVIVDQDGSKEDVPAEEGLIVFAVSKGGHTSLRTSASRGAVLFAARLSLHLASEAHASECSLTRAGQKCVEGMKYDAVDLLLIELLALGHRPEGAPLPPGVVPPTISGNRIN